MEALLTVIIALLITLVATRVKVLSCLSTLNDGLNRIWTAVNEFHYHFTNPENEIINKISNSFVNMASNIPELKFDIHEIKYVADILLKYNLPNKEDRDLLDRISIDQEVEEKLP